MPLVYKYLPPERATYLEDQLLRFSQPTALNDPYECLPALPNEVYNSANEALMHELNKPVEIASDDRKERRIAERTYHKMALAACRKLRASPGYYFSILADRFYEQASEKLNSLLCIFSLSGRWDSGLMWSHYTNSHSGFCIGFNRNHPFFSKLDAPDETALGLRPVKYSNHRVCVRSRRLTKEEARDILISKSLDWSYEKEERLIAMLTEATVIRDAVPFPIALFEVPHGAIAEIILGIRTEATLKRTLTTAAERLGVPVFQAELSRETFDIERRCIVNEFQVIPEK